MVYNLFTKPDYQYYCTCSTMEVAERVYKECLDKGMITIIKGIELVE